MAKKPITKFLALPMIFFCLMAQAQPLHYIVAIIHLHVGHAPTAVQYITYFEALKQAS